MLLGNYNAPEISILEMVISFSTTLACYTENLFPYHFLCLLLSSFGLSYISDYVDIWNTLEISFPMVYPMSLYRFFLGWPNFWRNSTMKIIVAL